MEITSPLTHSTKTSVLTHIATREIVHLYRNSFNIDVSKYFTNTNELLLCKDLDTGYVFFHPEVNADSDFYENLQKFEWYYMDWKWEFQKIVEETKREDKVLEVGCGKGDFIKRLSQQGNDVVGLEFNRSSVKELTNLGYKVFDISLNELSKKYPEKFDVVVSFQVLEHIYDVNEFITSSMRLLKKKGKLIISVPNNDSFIKHAFPSPLNMPPHHAGWWTRDSLLSLETIFDLKSIKILYEPLQDYHFDFYYETLKNRAVKKYGYFTKLLFFPFRSKRHRPILSLLKNQIKGQTITAIFQKT